MTHPRVLYLLAFLVSSVSKRNPVGRKPKRKVFAMEGLSIAERELRKEVAREIRFLFKSRGLGDINIDGNSTIWGITPRR